MLERIAEPAALNGFRSVILMGNYGSSSAAYDLSANGGTSISPLAM
jgi:hypothetical protein